jgi:hypothetical protein
MKSSARPRLKAIIQRYRSSRYKKAKLAGVWIERKERRAAISNYAISDEMPTEEQWAAERTDRILDQK